MSRDPITVTIQPSTVGSPEKQIHTLLGGLPYFSEKKKEVDDD